MLELFKGQISLEDIKYNLCHKELLLLRDARIKRLQKEHEAMQGNENDGMNNSNQGLTKEQARDMILKDLNYFTGYAGDKPKKGE